MPPLCSSSDCDSRLMTRKYMYGGMHLCVCVKVGDGVCVSPFILGSCYLKCAGQFPRDCPFFCRRYTCTSRSCPTNQTSRARACTCTCSEAAGNIRKSKSRSKVFNKELSDWYLKSTTPMCRASSSLSPSVCVAPLTVCHRNTRCSFSVLL